MYNEFMEFYTNEQINKIKIYDSIKSYNESIRADFEILNEEPGMVGTTFREWIEEDGKRVEMCGKVTEFVENEKISMSLSGKFNSVDVKFVLKKIESGTCLTQIANLRFNSSYKLMTIIMRPVIKKKSHSNSGETFCS